MYSQFFKNGIQIVRLQVIKGQLKIIRFLDVLQNQKNHDEIQKFKFMQKSNRFILKSENGSVQIWKQGIKQIWQLEKILCEDIYEFSCFIINKFENMIISGNEQGSIKIWLKDNQWKCEKTFNYFSFPISVFDICLNISESKLVSIFNDGTIIIIEMIENKTNLLQKIKLNSCGNIFFHSNETFTVVSINGTFRTFSEAQDKFQIINESSRLGYSYKNIFVKYIYQKQLILIIMKEKFNLLRKTESFDFILEQKIKSKQNILTQECSQNGDLFVIVNKVFGEYFKRKGFQIQIHKLIELI